MADPIEFDPEQHCGPFYNEPYWRTVCAIGFGLICVVGTFANLAILVAFKKHADKMLVDPHDYFLLAIVVTDLAMSVGCNVVELVDYVLVPCFSIGYVGCFVQNYFDIVLMAQNPANVALLTCDRLAMLSLGARYRYVSYYGTV